jgi:DNA-binding response OmpR family regulator
MTTINFDTWRIGDERMSLGDRRLLEVFVSRAGVAVSKRDLYRAWYGGVPQNNYGRLTSRAVETRVSRLRRKGVPLENIWGFGYRLAAEDLDVLGDFGEFSES